MIGVIDYRAGNAAGVLYAMERLGIAAEAVHTAEELEKYQGLILSGMGSADAAIISLESEELLEALQRKVLMDKVPLLGIGTGMEILFEHSEEDDTPCLGWLPGEAFLLPKTERMPQIGYYEVKLLEKHPLFEGCKGTERYFFSGSSYIRSEDAQLVLGQSFYGTQSHAAVAWENILGIAFHAEKSGATGLKVLQNFVKFAEGRQTR